MPKETINIEIKKEDVYEYAVKKLDKNHTITVTAKITKEFKLRLWLALTLMNMAASILGCGFKIEDVKIIDDEGDSCGEQ